ncbi:hypothetical protein GTQ40_17630 [Flavobacteriaceae bacterium R38]|nr:hypothetical protein [Flavobacteriaceae bacterium R38]
MNRLSKDNTDKVLHLLCITGGFILLFFINSVDELISTGIKIVGFILTMYGLFSISTKWVKDDEKPPKE